MYFLALPARMNDLSSGPLSYKISNDFARVDPVRGNLTCKHGDRQTVLNSKKNFRGNFSGGGKRERSEKIASKIDIKKICKNKVHQLAQI